MISHDGHAPRISPAVRPSLRGHPARVYNIHVIARAPICGVPLTGNRQTDTVWPPVYSGRSLNIMKTALSQIYSRVLL